MPAFIGNKLSFGCIWRFKYFQRYTEKYVRNLFEFVQFESIMFGFLIHK